MKESVYTQVTKQIVEALEKGVVPWRKTWASSSPTNICTKKAYRGINTILLSLNSYTSPYWATFKQVQGLGGSVKKGEKSTTVVYWQFISKTDDDGNEVKFPMLKYYQVFNIEQTTLESPVVEFVNDPIVFADAIINGMPNAPKIEFGNKACYSPVTDKVTIPELSSFLSAEEYYSTLFHELGHSTGHASRLDRTGVSGKVYFASDDYSFEELIAEFTAAYLCGETGIVQPVIENQAAYIQNWLTVLKGDNTILMKAASAAQKATDYIVGR